VQHVKTTRGRKRTGKAYHTGVQSFTEGNTIVKKGVRGRKGGNERGSWLSIAGDSRKELPHSSKKITRKKRKNRLTDRLCGKKEGGFHRHPSMVTEKGRRVKNRVERGAAKIREREEHVSKG